MATPTEIRAMRRALALSTGGWRSAFPNPLVGAVVLAPDGSVAGEGFHERCGMEHAEKLALREAGPSARGGTLVVSLEPCCHTGRTGPCTSEIIGSGIGRVVISMEDPDPRVCGGGISELRKAGIEVESGILRKESEEINRLYLHYLRKGRSWLVLKIASSIDGRVAASDGSSRWITGEESRRRVHRLRAASHAVMTGAGTARADDPGLDVRLAGDAPQSRPARILVTSSGRLSSVRRVFDSPGRVIVACPEGTDLRLGSEEFRLRTDVWELPAGNHGISLTALLRRTASEGLGRILCEAGPVLAAGLIAEELVDHIIIFTAPVIVGGNGIPSIHGIGVESLGDALRLRDVSTFSSGSDTVTEGDIVYGTDTG